MTHATICRSWLLDLYKPIFRVVLPDAQRTLWMREVALGGVVRRSVSDPREPIFRVALDVLLVVLIVSLPPHTRDRPCATMRGFQLCGNCCLLSHASRSPLPTIPTNLDTKGA